MKQHLNTSFPLFNFLIKKIRSYYWLILAILTVCFALNDQSLWIDEGSSALFARQDSLNGLWQQALEIRGSDAQTIFYYWLLWVWASICPYTEMGLRSLNVLFVVLGAFFLRKYPTALLLFCISPFVIYYTEELRPYMLQITASCSISALFFKESVEKIEISKRNIHFFFVFGLFLCMTSLSSAVWFAGFFVAFFIVRKDWLKNPHFYKILLIWFIPYLLLASYYIYTLFITRASPIKSSWIFNIGTSLYETLGITGWGPSRLLV
ncbi:MAG: hypothetical protein RSD12_06800, partial [Akkermansia sp.]